ncbi:MAG: serine--tRNA ligase [Acidaminococcales bacterium]|jgi:seryl-tRNA synthetase|nr:serine--tRNA ligase [Acidaminococcales bacterium]
MLDIKFIRENTAIVEDALKKRRMPMALDEFLRLDKERRSLLITVENLKSERNQVSQEISRLKKTGADAAAKIASMRETGDAIAGYDAKLREIEESLREIALRLPNIPNEAVPPGQDERDNPQVRKWGAAPDFPFPPKPHWEIGERLNILDFERAGKVAGARFVFYRGLGARLERALINFMLDLHTKEHGYTEVFPPFIVNGASMTGTGQLPKFAADAFRLENSDYYLVPTAEVPVTNMHRGEILAESCLPLYYAAYSACFRSEAGAAGRDTRGLIRLHQFNKVELVKFSLPENSWAELEKLTADAESVLRLLELPYRTVKLCAGDLGFASALTYDIEVWLPSAGCYREISSCSNFVDFQARRADIRFRRAGGKPEFVHTLNGSGLAIGRAVSAILENCQQKDGSVRVPQILQEYMGTDTIK